jgi:DNA-binding CsgD family transcriptional regulator
MEKNGNYSNLKALSPREITCLEWIIQGKTAEEIAMILNLKIITVKFYLRNIRDKLNCTSIAQAVYKALKYQLIF